MSTIYVSIASYRDRFLQSTIDSLFANASNPDDISVGCFVQIIPDGNDQLLCLVTDDYGGRVKQRVQIAGSVFSVTECRNNAYEWITKEHRYFLQCDAHTRFDPGWDDHLVNCMSKSKSTKTLLSTYCGGWTIGSDGCEKYQYPPVGPTESFNYATYCTDYTIAAFASTGELVCSLETRPVVGEINESWHLSGGFVFGDSEYPLSHPQNEHIVFWGEELWNSLVAFTNGWNVYAPAYVPIRHLYPDSMGPELNEEIYGSRDGAPRIWRDFTETWIPAKDRSGEKIIRAILYGDPDLPLGKDRTLAELSDLFGCDITSLMERLRMTK